MQCKRAVNNTVIGKGQTTQDTRSASLSCLRQSDVFWGKDGRDVPCPLFYLRVGEDHIIDSTASLLRCLTSNNEGGQ